MTELQFLNVAIENLVEILLLTLACGTGLWLSVRKRLIAGVLDPFALAFVVAFGINYAIVVFMLLDGYIDFPIFSIVAIYGALLIGSFRVAAGMEGTPFLFRYIAHIGEARLGAAVFYSALAIYAAFSLLIFWSIGFGILAETNRFDVARGYGAAIRVLDSLSPFIICYSALTIVEQRRGRIIKFGMLGLFILYAAVVNGAKASVILSFSTVFLALSVTSFKIKVSIWQAVLTAIVGLSFSVLALNINLENNNVRYQNNDPLAVSADLLTSRLVYRLIGFGDTSYLLLPNRVVDNLQKDSVLARFTAPIVGNDNLSRILGYEVADFSVGRQALLHYAPGSAVGGGPTSHFDLFSYVYFGTFGGGVFVIFLGSLLGRINRAVNLTRALAECMPNKFLITLVATLWSRAVLLVIEPTVALAYILDIFIIFTAMSVFWSSVLGAGNTRSPKVPG